jgi:hypothetical protein
VYIMGSSDSPDIKAGFGYGFPVIFCPDDRFEGEIRIRSKGNITEKR